MATKLMGSAMLCILVWLLRLKLTLAIGYPPMVPPISNHSEDENTTVYTVHQNETLRVSIKRISKEFEQILYKDDKPILGLDKSNKTVYVNDSGSDQGQLKNIQMYFHMKILNESHTEVIIRCGTNFVEGNYYVKYDGVSLLEEPHPSRFSVRFAESLPSLRPSSSIFPPSPSLASSTQNYITESLSSTSPSASFFTPSQSLAPTTQIASAQENLSTQSAPTIALSTYANGSTGTDETKPSIWIAVGIGCGCAALAIALLVAFLVRKKRARSRTKSRDTSSTELTNTSVTQQQQR